MRAPQGAAGASCCVPVWLHRPAKTGEMRWRGTGWGRQAGGGAGDAARGLSKVAAPCCCRPALTASGCTPSPLLHRLPLLASAPARSWRAALQRMRSVGAR